MEKIYLRDRILSELRSITPEIWLVHSELIFQNIQKLLLSVHRQSNLNLVGGYVPLDFEPQINWIDLLMGSMAKLSFPEVQASQMIYKSWNMPRMPKSWSDKIEGEEVTPDIVFIPGLTLNQRGFRLGYGKGFFDKYFEKNKIQTTVGICLTKFFNMDWPIDEFDKSFDFVVTENFVWSVNENKEIQF